MSTGMQWLTRRKRPLLILIMFGMAGCASAPTTAPTIIRTAFNLPANHAGFGNMLVISVAGDYSSRALFERNLAAAFADDAARMTAYFTVVGRQPVLTRTALETAILSRRFDAVLLTRLKGQEKAELVSNRPIGQSFDLFGYDYGELNVPSPIEQAPAITFVTELYSTATRKKIWGIESLSFAKQTATDLIEEQADTLIAQLIKDEILAR
jgi:hypothetical protein